MRKPFLRGLAVQFLPVFLLLCLGARAQVIDLEAKRLMVTPVGENWRFHAGDDPRWARPGLDDASWKLVQPTGDWAEQGYAEQRAMAWFRFKVLVPPHTPSLVLQLPRIDKNYQLFADGLLIGQAGGLPPGDPVLVTNAARVFTLPGQTGETSRVMVLALRMWEPPGLQNMRPDAMRGRALLGAPAVLLSQFATAKSAALLGMGSEYTQMLVEIIIGASALLLFLFTRRAYYLWFALNMFVLAIALPVRLASQHFAWGYFQSLDLYIALDFLGGLFFALFLLGTLEMRRGWQLAIPIGLELLAELGPVLLVHYHLPGVWADGIYFTCMTTAELVLVSLLIRGWRAGSIDAKLLLIPYGLEVLSSGLQNLAYFLIDLHVPHAGKLLFGSTKLVAAPFAVTVNDVSAVLSLLGLLAVLVYRFAQTSRDQQRLASALKAAHDIQHRLVPVDIPRLGGLHTEVVYLAAEEVGGDFCQVLPRNDGSILVAIGDVSGKGLQAAMLGTLAVGALRAMADEDIAADQVLQRLNEVVLRTGNAGFITCLCLQLSERGQVSVANAGHPSPYLNGEEVSLLPGLPLGIVAGVEYDLTSFLLPPNARLTLLSDGVVEARSRSGELFGFDRTSHISQLPASQIAAAAHKHGQQDDITVITLDWRLPAIEQTRMSASLVTAGGRQPFADREAVEWRHLSGPQANKL